MNPEIAKITGCRAHSCGDQALLWIDTENKKSVFAINSFPFSEAARDCVTLGSRTNDDKGLPKTFWNAFAEWSKDATHAKCAYFVDGTKEPPVVRKIELH